MESRIQKLQLRLIDEALHDLKRGPRLLTGPEARNVLLDLRLSLQHVADLAWLDAEAAPPAPLYDPDVRPVRKRPFFASRRSRPAERRT